MTERKPNGIIDRSRRIIEKSKQGAIIHEIEKCTDRRKRY